MGHSYNMAWARETEAMAGGNDGVVTRDNGQSHDWFEKAMGCYAIKQARALGMGVMHDSTLVEGGFIARDEEEPETEETLRIRQGIMPLPIALFKAMEESMKAAAWKCLARATSQRPSASGNGCRSQTPPALATFHPPNVSLLLAPLPILRQDLPMLYMQCRRPLLGPLFLLPSTLHSQHLPPS